MKRKLNILIILLVLLGLTSVTVSLAFLTKSVETNNVIVFGNIKIKLHETVINDDGKEVVDTDKGGDILKASGTEKYIRVENTGSHPAFVRVSLNMYEETLMEKTLASETLVSLNTQSSDWVYSDGWYYYNKVLMPGEKTEAIKTKIIFDVNEITAKHKDSSFDLDIKAQGVQSENNCDNVLDVVGWPEEQEEKYENKN